MSTPNRRRLSALIVNHDSGAWALRCVESLMIEWEREGRHPDDLDIVVLDSGSNPAESTWWRSLRRTGARVKTTQANVGYATGLNMAFELTSGDPDDFVALLNPDLYFLPGSLAPLLERLEEEPSLGAVGPRLFLDEERAIHLPQNVLPTPARELGELLSAHWPALGRRLAQKRSALSKQSWRAQELAAVEMLSGACLFLRRETILDLGAPMDGRFPLYFEDADLCARLRGAGLGLEVVADSQVLHHWSRSAGPDFEGEVAKRHAFSRKLWMKLHHGDLLSRGLLALRQFLKRRFERHAPQPIHPIEDLGALSESPEIQFPRDGEFLLELSLTPFWGLSAGIFVQGEEYSLPARSWSWLFPGTYYLRALDAHSGRFLGAWCFEKRSPARSWPLDPKSFQQTSARSNSARLGERVG